MVSSALRIILLVFVWYSVGILAFDFAIESIIFHIDWKSKNFEKLVKLQDLFAKLTIVVIIGVFAFSIIIQDM